MMGRPDEGVSDRRASGTLSGVALPGPDEASAAQTVGEFLARLQELDVRVWIEGDRLRCSAPSGVLTPTLRDQLGRWKPELLRLLPRSEDRAAPRSIPRLPDQPAYVASFTQERMWLLQQLAPTSPAYTVAGALRIAGPLQVGALKDSWNELVDRHELLRARFRTIDGQLSVVLDGAIPRSSCSISADVRSLSG
jgi:hypothetical protein